MRRAQLQNAELTYAQLQGADLGGAQLQGANLQLAQLQGANLPEAQLQGADLSLTQLQGSDLAGAQLQGANLWRAQLQNAKLTYAQLQGADLRSADLHGADLRSAELYSAIVEESDTMLVDLRTARWTPLKPKRLAQIGELLVEKVDNTQRRKEAIERLERAGNAGLAPPILESCLIDPAVTPELNCEQKWLPAQIEAFRSKLFPVLEKLACQSSAVARGLIRQIDANDKASGRSGLAGRFASLVDKPECKGLNSLPEADKNLILDLAKREQELRGQSGAGKPAG